MAKFHVTQPVDDLFLSAQLSVSFPFHDAKLSTWQVETYDIGVLSYSNTATGLEMEGDQSDTCLLVKGQRGGPLAGLRSHLPQQTSGAKSKFSTLPL